MAVLLVAIVCVVALVVIGVVLERFDPVAPSGPGPGTEPPLAAQSGWPAALEVLFRLFVGGVGCVWAGWVGLRYGDPLAVGGSVPLPTNTMTLWLQLVGPTACWVYALWPRRLWRDHRHTRWAARLVGLSAVVLAVGLTSLAVIAVSRSGYQDETPRHAQIVDEVVAGHPDLVLVDEVTEVSSPGHTGWGGSHWSVCRYYRAGADPPAQVRDQLLAAAKARGWVVYDASTAPNRWDDADHPLVTVTLVSKPRDGVSPSGSHYGEATEGSAALVEVCAITPQVRTYTR